MEAGLSSFGDVALAPVVNDMLSVLGMPLELDFLTTWKASFLSWVMCMGESLGSLPCTVQSEIDQSNMKPVRRSAMCTDVAMKGTAY